MLEKYPISLIYRAYNQKSKFFFAHLKKKS